MNDITYDDALTIMQTINTSGILGRGIYMKCKRTNIIPFNYNSGSGEEIFCSPSNYAFSHGDIAEEVMLLTSGLIDDKFQKSAGGSYYIKAMSDQTQQLRFATENNKTLKAILGFFRTDIPYIMVLPQVTEVFFVIPNGTTKQSVRSYCPNLRLECLQFLVRECTNTAGVTITVHADIYAKITDEGNADWHQLMVDGAEKNISFVSA